MSDNTNTNAAKPNLLEKVLIGYLNADEIKGSGTKMDKAKAIGKCALYGAAISTASALVTYGVASLVIKARGN